MDESLDKKIDSVLKPISDSITNFIFDNYKVNYVSAFALSKHNFKRGKMLLNMIEKILINFLDQSEEKKNW